MENGLGEIKKFRRWVDGRNAICLGIELADGKWKAALFAEGDASPEWVEVPAEIDCASVVQLIPGYELIRRSVGEVRS